MEGVGRGDRDIYAASNQGTGKFSLDKILSGKDNAAC